MSTEALAQGRPQARARDHRLAWAAVLVGVLLALPSVRIGFLADDYMQVAVLEGWSPTAGGPLELYTFVPADRARAPGLEPLLPWWAPPELRVAFLRPLSSATIALDQALFGRNPLGYHLHSILWFAAALAAAAIVFRGTLPARTALIATVLFAIDDAHAMAAGWIADRHSTVAVVPVLLAFVAHRRYRTEGWHPGRALALVGVGMGLLGGESALTAIAYLFAWELVIRRRGWRAALAPHVALIAVYLVLHRAWGGGTRGSGGYLDPFTGPLSFLRELPARLVMFVGNLLFGASVDLAPLDAGVRLVLIAIGAAALILSVVWGRAALAALAPEERRETLALVVGALGSLLTAAAAMPGERTLLAATVGSSAFLAVLLRDGVRRWRAPARRPLVALGLILIGLPNVAAAPLLMQAKLAMYRQMADATRALAAGAELPVDAGPDVVLLQFTDLQSFHLPFVRAIHHGPDAASMRPRVDAHTGAFDEPVARQLGFRSWRVLSLAATLHAVTRTGPSTLELSTPSGTFLDGPWPPVFRSREWPMRVGEVVRRGPLTVTVREAAAGVPTRISVEFDRPLEAESLRLLAWDGARLTRWNPPPLGQQVQLRASPHVHEMPAQR